MKKIHDKNEIVAAGLGIVLSRGYNATGVEAILKEAKVPKGSFYNFFSSKEEFGLAIIDHFIEQMGRAHHSVLQDDTLPPLLRIRRYFESIADAFEGKQCSDGCLIGNLALEMSDQNERFRGRLEEALQRWTAVLKEHLLEAQRENALAPELDAEVLAENLIASFEGALLRSRVKKSPQPLRNFIHLYFDVFLG